MTPPRKHFHFVGIGGIGMAALAELMFQRGHRVTGTDLRATPTTDHLVSLGVDVTIGHDARLVGDADEVIRSSAIPADNPEIRAAEEAGQPIIGRGALLARVMADARGLAIAGSHGKTTTSAMTAHLLAEVGLDPTALIGGRVPTGDGSASPTLVGKSDWLVAEVDESDGSFLLTRPEVAVITNIDPEHLDHYGTPEALDQAFVDFAHHLPSAGLAILGIDHPGVRRVAPRIESNALRYGFAEAADLRILDIAVEAGGQRVRARDQRPEGTEFSFRVPMPGRHNVQNALAAIAVGLHLGAPLAALASAVERFPGVARRFESKGEAGGIRFVDDYAHHPAEVEALLEGARSVHAGRIVAIFQPHRFTRTRDCWEAFLTCFDRADQVVLSSVYSAGEPPIEGIDSEALATSIAAQGHPDVRHGGDLDRLEGELPGALRPGDLVLTLGAGDIVRLGPRLCAAVEAAGPAGGANG